MFFSIYVLIYPGKWKKKLWEYFYLKFKDCKKMSSLCSFYVIYHNSVLFTKQAAGPTPVVRSGHLSDGFVAGLKLCNNGGW